MSAAPVKLWRYVLPSVKGEGWAIVHLDSKGFFGVVSDFGNYAYLWTHHGRPDFREFVIGLNDDYVCSKLGGRNELQVDRTVRAIREAILERRRERRWSAEKAREEWDLVDRLGSHAGDLSLDDWIRETSLDDPWEYGSYGPPAEVVAFARRIMPRLAELLRAELAAERQQSLEVTP